MHSGTVLYTKDTCNAYDIIHMQLRKVGIENFHPNPKNCDLGRQSTMVLGKIGTERKKKLHTESTSNEFPILNSNILHHSYIQYAN